MAAKPVGSAIADNRGVSMMGSALEKAGLVDTLNAASSWTVFVPSNGAFARMPEEQLVAIAGDRERMTLLLRNHIVAGRLSSEQISGTHNTLAGSKVTVTDDKGTTIVNSIARVVCANVKTTNAAVYFIDTVLTPS
ncbi:fasciclin domain-containing protein [Actinoplanes aureus]|uniref:Fasciclin domain-containing protein n=1 Tax=Actinoplanes aureus TaxID=2792083 RepID=A0A931CKG4_9ACTN|nr:fasciclin domain-containing protein [Actinoplanes aureus]MBG0569018.1 fasciclin domain-containing protein [Actinoplanes aureus]